MPKKRQLAAILFADIMGYTAMMQEDESKALEAVQKFRSEFKTEAARFGGRIVQFYGDGCLVIFGSAVDALKCAATLQRTFQSEPEVPVRMGLHSGDVFFEDSNIYGDSVNLASRIESAGAPGSILFSETIQHNIKNQPEFTAQSLGSFLFKNVEAPMEVFALANEGLVVPEREDLGGKLEPYTGPSHLWKRLWNRGIPQMLGAYLLSAWVTLQFLEWILNRYQLSPHWTDVALTIFLAMFPSVVFYIWHRKRISSGQLSLAEKLTLPANVVATLVLIFFLFRGTELGAINQLVSIEDENGMLIERLIVKPEFRKRVLVFPFKQDEPDSTLRWLEKGIGLALWLDLDQDRYLMVQHVDQELPLREKIEAADGSRMNYFLTGSYKKEEDVFTVLTKLYDLKEGKYIEERRFAGENPLEMIDTISLFIRRKMGLSDKQLKESLDLPFGEAFTRDTAAFRHLVEREEPKAIRKDSTFVLAAYYYADHLNRNQTGNLEARSFIDLAMRERKRLPPKWELAVQSLYYQVYDRPDKATALLELQTRLNPDNIATLSKLRDWYATTWKLDQLIGVQERIVSLNPEPVERVNLANYYLFQGLFTRAEVTLERVLNEYPENIDALNTLSDIYLNQSQYSQAKGVLNRMALIAPEAENILEPVYDHLTFANGQSARPETNHLMGIYRQDNNTQKVEVIPVNDQLYVKPVRQQTGLFAYPYSPNEYGSKYVGSDNQKSSRVTFVRDSVVVMKMQQKFGDREPYTGYYWKQDSTIWKAEKLLLEDETEKALNAYRIAAAGNPGHYYLPGFIRHLEFALGEEYANDRERMKQYVGKYGALEISHANDKLFFQRDKHPRMQLYPISANRFIFLEQYNLQVEIETSGGRVTRIVPWYYNRETKAFEKQDKFQDQ